MLADRVLEQELIPVQRAINSLARGGAALESGDVKAAASALGWVAAAACSALPPSLSWMLHPAP